MGTREVNQDVTGTPTSRKKLIASMDNKTLLYLNDTGLLAAYLKGDCSEELFAYVSKTAQGVLTTRGDLLFRGAVVPTRLAKGTLGQLLAQGANDPQWSDAVLVRGGILTRDNLGVVELSVGAADEVLTSDGTDAAWAAAGGGSLSLLENIAVTSSVATWTSVGAMTNDKQYMVHIRHLLMSADAGIYMRVKAAGAVQSNLFDYSYSGHSYTRTATALFGQASTANMIIGPVAIESASLAFCMFTLWFGKYQSGDYWGGQGNFTYRRSDNLLGSNLCSFQYRGSTTKEVQGIQLRPSTGNILEMRGEIYEVAQ